MRRLEFTKRILKKVYHDKKLFMIELVKAFKYLSREEKKEFKQWSLQEFDSKELNP